MKNILSLFLILFTCIVLCNCQRSREKTAEKLIEKSIGGNVNVDVDGEKITIETDEGKIVANTGDKKWPNEIPSVVPEFKFGKIENVSLRDLPELKIWAMVFDKVSGNDLSKYQDMLKEKGFETSFSGMENVGGMVRGEKDDVNVAVMFGEGRASITVTLENK